MCPRVSKKRLERHEEKKRNAYKKERVGWAIECLFDKEDDEEIYSKTVQNTECINEPEIKEREIKRLELFGKIIGFPTFLYYEDGGSEIQFHFCKIKHPGQCRLKETGFQRCKKDGPSCILQDLPITKTVQESEIEKKFEREW